MTATTAKRQPGESRDEHLERWKREQPERVAAHRAKREGRSAPVRMLLQTKDFMVGALALALVAALLLAAILLVGWFLWELLGELWQVSVILAFVVAFSITWGNLQGR